MRQKNIKKNNKFNNSCNQNECNNKNLIFSSQFNSCISECNKFKEMANQKCQQAECAMNRANKIAQEAQEAEKRAEALKRQAIEECKKANELWECYEESANSAQDLMEEAQCCLQEAAKCYRDCYKDDVGCNLDDFGYDEDEDEAGDDMKLTSLQSITDFMNCAGRTLPDNIRLWARRNLAVARSHEVSPEERRHAQRALSIMMNVQWKSNYFEAIDPDEARRILDEELYGMERVKQRIIETIIQINRTHTLPAYGLLLVGPAGTGKSQIAYAVARILKLPWTTLDMSSINDPEQLTGSSRIYANAKTGIIMDAFAMAGESNLVFIINELDKAASGKGNGNPADVLLTLLDNLGFTDNYIECMIPTVGVYPIATANDKSQISAPLMSRFAVIDIPDYTPEEKKVIFSKFALPKVLKRMSLKEDECIMSEEGLDELIKLYSNTSGIRDLEQAAEHIAANALYQIEVDHVKSVTFDAEMVRNLLR